MRASSSFHHHMQSTEIHSYPVGLGAWPPSPHDPTLQHSRLPDPSAPQIGPRIPSCSLEDAKVMTCTRSNKKNKYVGGKKYIMETDEYRSC